MVVSRSLWKSREAERVSQKTLTMRTNSAPVTFSVSYNLGLTSLSISEANDFGKYLPS